MSDPSMPTPRDLNDTRLEMPDPPYEREDYRVVWLAGWLACVRATAADAALLQQVQAELKKLEEQPIDTAPKDGTPVILLRRGTSPCPPPHDVLTAVGRWMTPLPWWPIHWSGWPNDDYPPTHWISLVALLHKATVARLTAEVEALRNTDALTPPVSPTPAPR